MLNFCISTNTIGFKYSVHPLGYMFDGGSITFPSLYTLCRWPFTKSFSRMSEDLLVFDDVIKRFLSIKGGLWALDTDAPVTVLKSLLGVLIVGVFANLFTFRVVKLHNYSPWSLGTTLT